MYVLGIETSTSVCGVAIIEEQRLVAEYRLRCKSCHSEKLVGIINKLLNDSKLSLTELGGVAVSIGPGSFTGLRIGLSVAKGLAYSLEVPLVDVPTLDALACQLSSVSILVCPILKARRDEVYTAFYRNQDGSPQRKSPYQILSLDDLLARVSEETVFVGDGVEYYGDRIKEQLGEKAQFACIYPSGVSVAQIGLIKLKQDQKAELDTLEPLYLHGFPTKKHV